MFAERAGFKNSNQEVPQLLLLNTEVLGVSFITLLLLSGDKSLQLFTKL